MAGAARNPSGRLAVRAAWVARRSALARNNLGLTYLKLDWPSAVVAYRESLAVQDEVGDLLAAAVTLDDLGAALQTLGESTEAVHRWEQALPPLSRWLIPGRRVFASDCPPDGSPLGDAEIHELTISWKHPGLVHSSAEYEALN